MKKYSSKDMAQVSLHLQMCEYASIHLVNINDDCKKIKQPISKRDYPLVIQRLFLINGFILSLGAVISYFHKAKDEELFGKMKSTPDQRREFFEKVRGNATHIADIVEQAKAIKDFMSVKNGVNWIFEFQIVKLHFFDLMKEHEPSVFNEIKDNWENLIKSQLKVSIPFYKNL